MAEPASIPPFDLERLAAEPFIRAIMYRSRVDSTNDWALRLIRESPPETPLLVLTAEQTAGRGRGQNRWWSSPGALTFSLVLDEQTIPVRKEHWPRISLCAALSVCESIESLASGVSCRIRWPNDVYVAERKIAGILAETVSAANRGMLLVLGIGINVNNSLVDAPPDIQSIGTSIAGHAREHLDLTDTLLELLAALQRNVAALECDDGSMAEAWSARSLLTGRIVELLLGERRIIGSYRGVDTDGTLILETPSGIERFAGGVVTRVS